MQKTKKTMLLYPARIGIMPRLYDNSEPKRTYLL